MVDLSLGVYRTLPLLPSESRADGDDGSGGGKKARLLTDILACLLAYSLAYIITHLLTHLLIYILTHLNTRYLIGREARLLTLHTAYIITRILAKSDRNGAPISL